MLGEGAGCYAFFSVGIRCGRALDASLQDRFPKWFRTAGGKLKAISNEVKEIDKFWDELLYNAAGGKAEEMNALRKFNIIDFFSFLENKKKNA